MNKTLMKRVIIDIENEGCPEADLPKLLDCFEGLMAKAASLNCRRASFELADLTLPSRQELSGYSLEIERLLNEPGIEKNDQVWTGIFTNGQHRLKVMGGLEDC